jgi:hypothetical protein
VKKELRVVLLVKHVTPEEEIHRADVTLWLVRKKQQDVMKVLRHVLLE